MTVRLEVVLLITCAALSSILVALVGSWAQHRNVLDYPNARSSHTRPTPRGGGIAIVVVTLGGLALLQWRAALFQPRVFATIGICGVALATLSWFDDVYSIPSAIRLAAHLGAALATTIACGTWRVFWIPFVGAIDLGSIGFIVSVFWIAGLTNAYNFMDGIDGIAGLQAVVAGIGWVIIGSLANARGAVAAGALIAASALGFLAFNWQPAKIFMGDVGSAFLGYMLASLTITGAASDPRLALAGMLLVWPFVFDTTLTFLRRAKRRERIFTAHRSHFYQRLTQTGVSHARVSTLYGLFAALGVVAAAMIFTSDYAVVPSVIALVIAAVLLVTFVIRRESQRA